MALSAYKANDYFFVRRNGFIGYAVSNLSDKGSAYLDSMTNAYMQMRAQKDGITYQNNRTLGHVMTSYVIGPGTKFPTEVSEIKKNPKIMGTLQERLMQNLLDLNRGEMWRKVQLGRARRRDLIPIATAGICTATACNYAGLPKRIIVSATIGAVAGTGTACWILNMLLNRE